VEVVSTAAGGFHGWGGLPRWRRVSRRERGSEASGKKKKIPQRAAGSMAARSAAAAGRGSAFREEQDFAVERSAAAS